MNRYRYVLSLFAIIFAISQSPSFSKPHTYTWAKGNIETSAEGELGVPGINVSQNKIMIKDAARSAGYNAIMKILMILPLDSTRRISDLEKYDKEFADKLPEWVALHSMLSNFKFTSETTGSLKITIDATDLAHFVTRYDKPVKVAVKTTKKATPAVNTKKEETKVEAKKMAPSSPRREIEVDVKIEVARDSTMTEKQRISKAEASVRGLAQDELYRQLSDIQVSTQTTYKQWITAYPESENAIRGVVDSHTMLSNPVWNSEKTQVRLHGRFELRFLQQAVREAKMKMHHETKATISKETTIVKPAPANKK